MRAAFACPEGATADSLTVSVSDTHRRYALEKDANETSLEAALHVPADQLTPVAAPDFCVDDERTDDESLLLPGIATAQVSLRCRSETEFLSIHFASVALPVRVYCQEGNDQEEPEDR